MTESSLAAAMNVPGEPAVRHPRRPRAFAACAMVIGLVASIQSHGGEGPPEIDPTGGLRSRAVVPLRAPVGLTREELVRQWDLDGNGKIDASEATVAKARMRRARTEMELGAGIDPLTGKPRVAADATPEESLDDVVEPGAEPAPDTRPRAADADAPPGTRVPIVGPVVSGTAALKSPSLSGAAGAGTSSGVRPSPGRPSVSGFRPGSQTGGVRAGAPAARSGYGALAPKTDLNAGLPRPPLGRPAIPGTRGAARGGFMPSVRSPAAPRPSSPTPGPLTPPRVTADDIGGY